MAAEQPSLSQPQATPRSRAERARLFVLLGGLTAFGPLSIDMYLPALPAIARELNAGESTIQLTLTACLVGLALGQIVAGPLSDTFGRRRPLLIGVAGYVGASLLCALAPSAPILIAFRLVQGLSGSAGIVIARAIVRDLYAGAAAARYFSRLILIFGLAPIFAPVLGGQILRFTSWHGIFVTLAVVTALLWLGALTWLPETLPIARRREGGLQDTIETFAGLLRDTRFIGYALAGGLAFGAMFAYIAGSPFVLQGIYHVSPQVFSVIFGTNAFGFMITSQVNGSLVGRIDPARLLVTGLIVNALGSLSLLGVVLVGGLGLGAFLAPLFFLVSSIGLIAPNATALAISRHPEAAGTASALLGVIQSGTGSLTAPFSGLGGVTTALPMAGTMAVAGAGAITTFTLSAIAGDRRRAPMGSPAGSGGS